MIRANESREIVSVDILSKIGECSICNVLPSLFTMNVWEFDYNRVENLGCVRKSYQLGCRGCDRVTPIVSSVHEAIGMWNRQLAERQLDEGEENDGKGGCVDW